MAGDVVVFVDHANLVFDLTRDDELVGIDDDADPVAVAFKAEVEDGQAALDGDRGAHRIAQLEFARGREFLFAEKTFAQCAQPSAFVRIEPDAEGERGKGVVPEQVGDARRAGVRLRTEESEKAGERHLCQRGLLVEVRKMPDRIIAMPRAW